MTTVSTNGSSKATIPSVIGSSVFTAAWAIEADPTPASLENAARWNPTISTPMMPPLMAEGANAPLMISPKACPVSPIFMMMMISATDTYRMAMNGTIFSVTLAILLIPPMITAPTRMARITPNIQPFPSIG